MNGAIGEMRGASTGDRAAKKSTYPGVPMRRSQTRALSCAAIILCAAFGIAPAQTPPPESASKVKRVLMYKKIGAWVNTTNISDIQEVFDTLAREKGFVLDTLDSDSALTLEFLQRYQAVIWNNNTNSGASLPSLPARKAMTDYLEQGGGWMLLNLAGDTKRTWPALDSLLGTSITIFGAQDSAHILADSSAKKHSELKHVVSAIPDTIGLPGVWHAFRNTVRPLPGVTVLYTQGMASLPMAQYADETTDRTYIWARDVGAGKLLYNGYWYNRSVNEEERLINLAGGAITNMYWQSLRWLAGDYQGGCINPAMANFDSGARVDDGSCLSLGVGPGHRLARPRVDLAGRRVLFGAPVAGGSRLRLLDLQGQAVWSSTPAGSVTEAELPDRLQPGFYFLEITGAHPAFRARILIP